MQVKAMPNISGECVGSMNPINRIAAY